MLKMMADLPRQSTALAPDNSFMRWGSALPLAMAAAAIGCGEPEQSVLPPPSLTDERACPEVPPLAIDLNDLPEAPVVALITVDTWRADHFTAELTPVLWQLAAEGEFFERGMSPMGLTSPAHATMFTGLQPWEHGVEGNNHHGYSLGIEHPVLADRFPGYRTGAFVSAYPAGPEGGLSRGWQTFSGPESGERPGWEAVREAVEWLAVDEPSLVWVHIYEPHGPYIGCSESDWERYDEEVARVDEILAPLISLLQARGARIVVAGDHGEVLDEETCARQHERSSSDMVLRVPLLRWEPELTSRVITGMVGLDQVPALLSGESWKEESVWLAESGLCEPGCNGCSPEGLQGRDRVAIGAGARLTRRPGAGWIEEGSVPVEWKAMIEAIPPVAEPTESETSEQVESLGY